MLPMRVIAAHRLAEIAEVFRRVQTGL